MKKLGKILLASMLVFLLAFALVGCGSDEAKEDKPLIVGTDAAYKPFEYQENGVITGFDIDLLTAIAEEMGLKLEFRHMDFDPGLIAGLQSGSINIAISAMTITDARAEQVDFSNPYFLVEGQAVLVKAGNEVAAIEELASKKVGVQLGTTGALAAEAIEGIEDKNINRFPTTPDAIMSLQTGVVDAVIADAPVVKEWLNANPNSGLVLLENLEFEPEEYGIAVKKGDKELLDKINEGLQKVKDNGKYEEIYNKYFNE